MACSVVYIVSIETHIQSPSASANRQWIISKKFSYGKYENKTDTNDDAYHRTDYV